MKKQITFGLIASALALSTAALAPTEAKATERERALNTMAMQMYMNNQAQQQYYNNYSNPYFGSPQYGSLQYQYGNPGYVNPYYGYNNRVITGNGWNRSHWDDNDRGYYNNNNSLRYNSSTVGRLLNRIL